MKFVYEYRTSDNVPHKGTIAAPNKDAAYDTLKAQGIKPGKVWEAPGVFNKVFGKGKRWMAIAILMTALVVSFVTVQMLRTEVQNAAKELEDITLFEDRGQIYGAKAVLHEMRENDYLSVFPNDSVARFLAAYAMPGIKVDEQHVQMPKNVSRNDISRRVAIEDSELEEHKKLKRIVNGMKREFCDYLADGGSVSGYVRRLEIRQQAEERIFERVKRELQKSADAEEWREKNAELRAKGLPMVESGKEN